MLLEQLNRNAAGNAAAPAAHRKVDAFIGEVGLAVVDVEHDAQWRVAFKR